MIKTTMKSMQNNISECQIISKITSSRTQDSHAEEHA